MEGQRTKNDIIKKLQGQILSMQGFREPSMQQVHIGLGPVEMAFPHGIFPTGAIHEFLSEATEEAAATSGFIAGVLGCLMKQNGFCLWISTKRTLFPPALKIFGINPEQVIFIDLVKEKDVLWVIEEALKCGVLSAVVGELGEMSFAQSRRLQLAVEQSQVTGLLHCYNSSGITNTISVARWQIIPKASGLPDGMPGIGHPCWEVRLLKVRNGKAGSWQLQWSKNTFQHLPQTAVPPEVAFEKGTWYGKAIS